MTAAVASRTGIHTEEMTIPPTLAQHWLEAFNKKNRKLSENIVEEYAQHLINDEWRLNGESIKFDRYGNLLDGQHRLAAIVRSGKAMQTFVTWGLEEEVYETLDSGKRRIAADAMHRNGEANSALLAATLMWQWRYEQGYLAAAQTRRGRYKPSVSQLNQILLNHPTIRVSVSWISRKSVHRFGPSSVLAWAHFRFSSLDPVLCEQFFQHLAKGEDLGSAHPILRLRERLIDNRMAKGKLPPHYILALIIKTWNAWVLPRNLRSLVWREDEPFPEAQPPTTNGFPPKDDAE